MFLEKTRKLFTSPLSPSIRFSPLLFPAAAPIDPLVNSGATLSKKSRQADATVHVS